MSDERLREVERTAALRPSDPEAIDALIEERCRLGLRVAPELYEQRVFPPLSFAAPPKSRLEWVRPGGRYRRPRYPSPSGDYQLDAHESFVLELRRQGAELAADLAAVAAIPEVRALACPSAPFGRGVARDFPQLEVLSLQGPAPLPDLRPLAPLTRLRSLSVSPPPASLSGLEALPRLQRLELAPWEPRLGERSWRRLREHPALVELAGWTYARGQSAADLAQLAQLPRLERIVLRGPTLDDASLAHLLARQPRLRRLWIQWVQQSAATLTSAGCAALTTCEALNELLLTLPLPPETCRALPASLHSLALGAGALDDDALRALCQRPLRSLSLNHADQLDPALLRDALANLEGLQHLELYGVRAACRQGALAALPTSLRELELARLAFLSDLSWIARLDSLEELTLWGCEGLPPEELRHLGALPRLRDLTLLDTPAGDPSPHLEGLTRLRSLRLADLPDLTLGPGAARGLARLRSLELDGVELGDASGLRGLPELRHLKLVAEVRLPEPALRALLSASPRLAHLDLTGPFPYDLEALRAAAPALDLEVRPA